jgi:hypothetical protein
LSHLALWLVFPAVLVAAASGPADEASLRRGPFEARDEWVLAQPRLTLGPTSPDPLADGETRVRVTTDWATSFGLELGSDQRLADPRFLVDGEARSLGLDVRRGVTPSLSVGARLTLKWRGGGILDGLVDGFHSLFGLPDNGRTLLPRDRLQVVGRDAGSDPIHWNGAGGIGLANLELSLLQAIRSSRSGWALSVAARVGLPTATGPFAGTGAGAGAQLVAARSIGRALDVYLGIGATAHLEDRLAGLRYPRFQPQGFAAVEWRAGPRVSLLAQANASGRLVEDLPDARRLRVEMRVGTKIDVGDRLGLEIALTEGVVNVDSTVDFGMLLGVTRRF